MTDDPSTAGSGWRGVIASLEASTPEELQAKMPGTGTPQLVRDFPEFGAVEFRDLDIEGPGGPVPARSYWRRNSGRGTGLVWIHGGGFIFGHLDMDEAHWVALALAARGITVVSVDYRKCLHGVHYPVPSDDVLAAWLWAMKHAGRVGIDRRSMHIGGASAGGNLAAGVTKRLRDGAGPTPSSTVLVYPVLHSPLPPPSATLRDALAQRNLDAAPGSFLETNYAGSDAALRDPYAFAGNGDVSRQPPVYILNAEADALRASGELYASQLQSSGVVVRVEFEPDTIHGHLNEPYSEGGRRSIDRIAAWLTAPGLRTPERSIHEEAHRA
jgi:acetyl esterase